MFNDPARKGYQYVMADYSAKYTGTERTGNTMFDLRWSFGGTDGQVYDPASVVTPKDKVNAPSEARPGGTVKQQVIFEVPVKAIKGGVVSVESGLVDSTYADFKF